ncbi:MAG: glutathione S-transferase N-terminal domain-containing protein [Methylococcales bacterium]|nr:glutathione S-transferase N-terminal domain-containing protein [Methylococcales bacterium]
MIEFYTAQTFNGHRIAIMLEETGLDYQLNALDLKQGEHRRPDFLALNPGGKIPVIIDTEGPDGEPFILSQSAAILLYLAEKTGQLLPESGIERYRVLEWLSFHATDIAPSIQSVYYLSYRAPEPQPAAAGLLRQRHLERYREFDQRLADQEFLSASGYSIADIAALPAVVFEHTWVLERFAHIKRWHDRLRLRPAVQRGLAIPG